MMFPDYCDAKCSNERCKTECDQFEHCRKVNEIVAELDTEAIKAMEWLARH